MWIGIQPARARWHRTRTIALAVALTASGGAQADASVACWHPPVRGVVVDPFRPPPCPWCPGNRGLEYETIPGATVRSVAAGRVTFSGAVAGTRYVVVELPNRWRLTYGRLAAVRVDRGDVVLAGSVVGRSGGAFYFGLRIDGQYVDPAPHLGRLVGRPRLVPTDGSPPRPAPPPRLRCGGSDHRADERARGETRASWIDGAE